jgi:hypothetical protein
MTCELPEVNEVYEILKGNNLFYTDDGGEDEPSCDVRLHITPEGSWEVLSGDSCYDTDHGGYWSYETILPAMGKEDLLRVAQTLIDGIKEYIDK